MTVNGGILLTGVTGLKTCGVTGNASLTNAKATVLGASNVGGNLTVTDSVGNLTQSGVLTVGGTSSFTTSAANATITLTNANLLTGAASLTTSGARGNADLTNPIGPAHAPSPLTPNLPLPASPRNTPHS